MRTARFSYFVIALLYTSLIAAYAVLKPSYNSDMLYYVAAALSYEESDPKVVHARTYEHLQRSAPVEANQFLRNGTWYLRLMATDPGTFHEILPFYAGKALYPLSIYLISQSGIDPISASVWISVLSSVFIAMLTYAWVATFALGTVSLAASTLLLNGAGILGLARLSTPDALSTALLLLSAYVFLGRQRPILACLVSILAIVARPDNIIVTTIVVAYCVCLADSSHAIRPRSGLALLLFSVLIYWIINWLVGSYSFQVFFSEYLVNLTAHPSQPHPGLSVLDYARVLFRGFIRILDPQPVNFWILLGIAAIMLQSRRHDLRSPYTDYCWLTLVAALARFLLFPVPEPRFFAASCLVVGIIFLRILFVPER